MVDNNDIPCIPTPSCEDISNSPGNFQGQFLSDLDFSLIKGVAQELTELVAPLVEYIILDKQATKIDDVYNEAKPNWVFKQKLPMRVFIKITEPKILEVNDRGRLVEHRGQASFPIKTLDEVGIRPQEGDIVRTFHPETKGITDWFISLSLPAGFFGDNGNTAMFICDIIRREWLAPENAKSRLPS